MKVLKPTEYDISFKYICPNTNCNYSHWLFLREAKQKKFKVVCDCGTVFYVKQINSVKILYNKKTETIGNDPAKQSGSTDNVPIDIMKKCAKILDSYGFDKQEVEKLINKAYKKTADKTVLNIIKTALSLLEINNV